MADCLIIIAFDLLDRYRRGSEYSINKKKESILCHFTHKQSWWHFLHNCCGWFSLLVIIAIVEKKSLNSTHVWYCIGTMNVRVEAAIVNGPIKMKYFVVG